MCLSSFVIANTFSVEYSITQVDNDLAIPFYDLSLAFYSSYLHFSFLILGAKKRNLEYQFTTWNDNTNHKLTI